MNKSISGAFSALAIFLLSPTVFLAGYQTGCWHTEEASDRVPVPRTETVVPEDKEIREAGSQESTEKPEPVRSARPSSFSKFRATFEVTTKGKKDPEYAKRQAKELRLLVRSIPSVESVEVLKIEGVDGSESFRIE